MVPLGIWSESTWNLLGICLEFGRNDSESKWNLGGFSFLPNSDHSARNLLGSTWNVWGRVKYWHSCTVYYSINIILYDIAKKLESTMTQHWIIILLWNTYMSNSTWLNKNVWDCWHQLLPAICIVSLVSVDYNVHINSHTLLWVT